MVRDTVAPLDTYNVMILKPNKNADDTGRAWAEISLSNLRHNIDEVSSVLPEDCKIMAVVKANAYGHGAVETAGYLNTIGIYDFAVADVNEGAELRRRGVKGNILILGYTHESKFELIYKYDLMQTVIDYDYALKLNKYKHRLKVHVKIDTGMCRLGENYSAQERLREIYTLSKLDIRGTFTHLGESDSTDYADVAYTEKQIKNFYICINTLRGEGFNTGKIHVQSSYGVVNYPNLKADYVRLGIAMYGMLSTQGSETKINLNLKPALSLKARVALVKNVDAGNHISYGRNYIMPENGKIAVITIGYADGIPRNICGGRVLINGKYANIIGNVCMDQMIADVSHIEGIAQDDIATLIGSDGVKHIAASEIAEKSGTITNEILSRLGTRIQKIYI